MQIKVLSYIRLASIFVRWADWQKLYAHPIYFTETFVDPQRDRGTCYRAANWTYLGMTTGRGKDAPTKRPNRPLKQLYGYPLVKDFRRRNVSIVLRHYFLIFSVAPSL